MRYRHTEIDRSKLPNLVKDVVEANGKTIYENNKEKDFDIPLGALVEIRSTELSESGVRLFVVLQERDCDGEPLYGLAFKPEIADQLLDKDQHALSLANVRSKVCRGYSRSCLNRIT